MSVRPYGPAKRRQSKSARAYGVDGRRGTAVRRMRCIGTTTELGRRYRHTGLVQASHTRARGMGGVNGDARDLVPQCPSCHRWWERDPGGYEYATGVHMAGEAERIALMLDEELGLEPCYLCNQVEGHSPMCKSAEAIAERRVACHAG
jgi:hypothetical protein